MAATPLPTAAMPDKTTRATTALLQSTLQTQRDAYLAYPVPTLAERKRDLRELARFVREHTDDICEAISADYGHRSRHETLLAEVVPVLDDVKNTLKNLADWMKPQSRSIDRLVFAAGNRAMVRMSENSRHLARLFIERLPDYFPPEKLQILVRAGSARWPAVPASTSSRLVPPRI